jgi:molybdopterin/thiamine biosynthesis adenylyltransferase
MKDVGQPKAVVAAERINARVPGVKVTPHFGRIEEKPVDWYRDFALIILGLDSLEVRSEAACVALQCRQTTLWEGWLQGGGDARAHTTAEASTCAMRA